MLFEKNFYTEDIVNVFVTPIKKWEPCLLEFSTYLSGEEKFQVQKFCTNKLKKDYISTHGLLRVLLGSILSIAPQKVEYTRTKFKKPLCKNDSNINFNMSHTSEWVCYIFSFKHQVGIDIEEINPNIDLEGLYPLIAASNEQDVTKNLSGGEKIYSFYKIWTMKEAFLKALGVGLAYYPLSGIETSVLPKENFTINRWHNGQSIELDKNWTFSPIQRIPNCLGSLAIKKPSASINKKYI